MGCGIQGSCAVCFQYMCAEGVVGPSGSTPCGLSFCGYPSCKVVFLFLLLGYDAHRDPHNEACLDNGATLSDFPASRARS